MNARRARQNLFFNEPDAETRRFLRRARGDAEAKGICLREAVAGLFGSFGDFCFACGDIGVGYMLRDELWILLSSPSERIVCLRCANTRAKASLGRELCLSDFTECLLNYDIQKHLDRVTGKPEVRRPDRADPKIPRSGSGRYAKKMRA